MKIAIIIAVQKYNDPTVDAIPFAENNATKLASSLSDLGYEVSDQICLINEHATKAVIESKLRRAMKSCLEEDELFLYYVGHSFSMHGTDYLTCVDSDSSKLLETSIPMSWLIHQFQECECNRLVLFLDSGETSKFIDIHSDRLIQPPLHSELHKYFSESKKRACFVACKPDERSHVSRKWKLGIWMHHILEALQGKAPAAIKMKTQLDASALQAYLLRSIPQTLATHYSSKSPQTPLLFPQEPEEVLVADLGSLLSAKRKSNSPYAELANSVTFFAERKSTVKNLSGFKKGNAVPDRANHAAQIFIAKLATDEVSNDLQSVFTELKSVFKFKRADLSVTNMGDGTGTITTPYFNYSISVEVDEANPAYVIWRRTVDAIKEPEQIFSDRFSKVFAAVFEAVEFATPNDISVDALIDSVEAIEDDRIEIEYTPDAKCCSLGIDGITGKIEVSKNSIKIIHERPEAPAYLLRSFFAIQKSLVDSDGTTLIPVGKQFE